MRVLSTKRILLVLAALLVSLIVPAWWLLVGGSNAAPTAPQLFPIETWRAALADDDASLRPAEIRLVEVGSDVAPRIAAQAGAFKANWRTSYGGFQVVTPQGSIFIDAGIDAEISDIMARSPDTSRFDQQAYDALLSGMERARHILLTHAHRDHVIAVARHPRPANIAPQLRLNPAQKFGLGFHSKGGVLPPELAAVASSIGKGLTRIAPGVLVSPAQGHSPGSQVVFVTLQSGTEFLFIGDIVWAISNIEDLKIRPRLTQVVVFDPNEDRTAIKQQVRALSDLSMAAPDLIFLPAHDRDHLIGLTEAGTIAMVMSD